MKMTKFNPNKFSLVMLLLLVTNAIFAQGGAAGLDAAAAELISYLDSLGTFVFAVGGIIGFVGAIRVYSKMSNGDPDTNKAIMNWGGACIFLVLVGTILGAFFGF